MIKNRPNYCISCGRSGRVFIVAKNVMTEDSYFECGFCEFVWKVGKKLGAKKNERQEELRSEA